MIFYLTNSLRIRDNDTKEYKALLQQCILNLVNSAYEGSNYLYGDYEILNDCIGLLAGVEYLHGYIRGIVNNWYTSPIPDCVTHYIEIVRENPSERALGAKTIAQRVINDLNKSFSLNPCYLVCEDETDCEFYRYLVDEYMKIENIHANVYYIDDASHGCGTALGNIRTHFNNNQTCICILDSDMTYPGKELKDVVKQCQNYSNDKCGLNCLVLNTHEVENLIPINFLEKAIKHSGSYIKYKDKYDKQIRHFKYLLEDTYNESILPYFDCKDGIKRIEEKEGAQDAQHKDFAKLCWSKNNEISTGTDFDTYLSSLGPDDFVYERLSNSLLEDTLHYISETKTNRNLEDPVLLRFQDIEWHRIGQALLNWGYASSIEGRS